MKKVYADKSLEYTDKDEFDVPEEYRNPCATRNKKNDAATRSQQRQNGGFDDLFN
jgi:penicillin-binding protein 1A